MRLRTKALLIATSISTAPLLLIILLLMVLPESAGLLFNLNLELSGLRDHLPALAVIFLAQSLFVFLALWLTRRSTDKRLAELINYLHLIFAGQSPRLEPDNHHDELSELRQSFLRLYEQMEQSRRELEINFQQLQISNMKVEEKYAQSYTLQLIQEEIGRELDTENLLKKTADIVIGVLGCKHCSIYLLDESAQELVIKAISGFISAGNLIGAIPVQSDHIIAKAFREKSIISHRNTPDSELAHYFKSYAIIPLVGRNDSFGVILLEHEIGGGVTEDLLDFAKLIAKELSLSVENASLYSQMKENATHDYLTGAYNRTYLVHYMEELFDGSPTDVAVILLDIDLFKSVNDRFGHLTGDAVLKNAAGLIQRELPGGILARYGGEEFVIVLPGMKQAQALQFAENIRELIECHRFLANDGTRIPVTISSGVACFPGVSLGYEKLLHLADEALYEAKNSGRNRVRVATATGITDSLDLFDSSG